MVVLGCRTVCEWSSPAGGWRGYIETLLTGVSFGARQIAEENSYIRVLMVPFPLCGIRVQLLDKTEILPPESPEHPLPLLLQVSAPCPLISNEAHLMVGNVSSPMQ